jgi:hypothetical protein
MSRALHAEWLAVAGADRAGAIADWRNRRANLVALGCHYWVFEVGGEQGRFLEFTEALDAKTLLSARAQAGCPIPVASVLNEVELS